MMKLYIAAPYEQRDTVANLTHLVQSSGRITVTSQWATVMDSLCHDDAQRDLEQIDEADVVLVLNTAEYQHKGQGGRHVELGYALGKGNWNSAKGTWTGKRILMIGTRSNIFHHLDYLTWVADYQEAIRVLNHWAQFDWTTPCLSSI